MAGAADSITETRSATLDHHMRSPEQPLCGSHKLRSAMQLSGDVDQFAALKRAAFETMQRARVVLLRHHLAEADASLNSVLQQHGIRIPCSVPATQSAAGVIQHQIDREKQKTYSSLLRKTKISLPTFVRLLRGKQREIRGPTRHLLPNGPCVELVSTQGSMGGNCTAWCCSKLDQQLRPPSNSVEESRLSWSCSQCFHQEHSQGKRLEPANRSRFGSRRHFGRHFLQSVRCGAEG